jgi:DNA-directed RNA polymerase subunit RPC12/RpoP
MNKAMKWFKENILKKAQINNNNQARVSYICPGCRKIITLTNEVVEPIIMACPECGQKGVMRPLQKKLTCINKNESDHKINFANSIDERKHIDIPVIEVKILGILLLALGIALLFVFNLVSIKISMVFIIIGVIIFTFIPSNRKIFINSRKPKSEIPTRKSSLIDYINYSLIKQIDISEKIAILLILWILFIYILTGVNDIDIFFIFVYLGILLMKVFSTEYVSTQLKQKINVFVIAFLFIFILIIARRILTVINL